MQGSAVPRPCPFGPACFSVYLRPLTATKEGSQIATPLLIAVLLSPDCGERRKPRHRVAAYHYIASPDMPLIPTRFRSSETVSAQHVVRRESTHEVFRSGRWDAIQV